MGVYQTHGEATARGKAVVLLHGRHIDDDSVAGVRCSAFHLTSSAFIARRVISFSSISAAALTIHSHVTLDRRVYDTAGCTARLIINFNAPKCDRIDRVSRIVSQSINYWFIKQLTNRNRGVSYTI